MGVCMAPVIRTHSDVARWIAIQTGYTLRLVTVTTSAGLYWRFGGEWSHPVDTWEAVCFFFGLALLETAVFTPLVAIRSVEVLRRHRQLK